MQPLNNVHEYNNMPVSYQQTNGSQCLQHDIYIILGVSSSHELERDIIIIIVIIIVTT